MTVFPFIPNERLLLLEKTILPLLALDPAAEMVIFPPPPAPTEILSPLELSVPVAFTPVNPVPAPLVVFWDGPMNESVDPLADSVRLFPPARMMFVPLKVDAPAVFPAIVIN